MKVRRFLKLGTRAAQLDRELRVLAAALAHRQTPWYARLVALLTVAYAVSPFDLLPDWIPILGQLDDLVVIPIGVRIFLALVPEPILLECRERAQGQWDRWTRAIYWGVAALAVLWLVLLALVVWWVVRLVGTK